MGTNTLTDRIDGQVVDQTFFNEIHQALNGTFPPRNASGVPTDVGGDLGSTTYRFNNSYIATMYFGAIASGLSFSEDSGDIVIKRNSVEVGRFTANGLDGSDLVAASVTLAKMAANSVDTSQLVNDSVTNAKIDAGAVDTTELANLAVETDKINSLAVTSAKLATDSVITAKIEDNAVSPSKMFNQSSGTYIRKTAAVSGSGVNNATTTVASVSFTPATTERVVRISLNSSSTTNSSINFSSSGAIAANVIFRRAGTTIASHRITSSGTDLTLPTGSFWFDYMPASTSSETYDVQFAADAVTTVTATGAVSFVVYHP